jgi:hypothetical protein
VRAKNLRNDARLLKTLLLAALVPEVESLKALTAQRLAALNHGTFRSPIPGREAQDVLRKCRDWASEIGEIKITDDQNPIISIQVTGVDIEPILRGRGVERQPGNRRKRIREAAVQGARHSRTPAACSPPTNSGLAWHAARGGAGLRERARDDRRPPARPLGRLDGGAGLSLRRAEPARTTIWRAWRVPRRLDTRTLVWLPSFLSTKALADLGRYVVLDYILQGERFENYAAHLSFVDRVQAKALARNQLDQLRIKLRSQLEVAYGIARAARCRDA